MASGSDKDGAIVIDEDVIRKAVEEEFESSKREDVDYSKYETPEPTDVTELRLSFRNIYQIDNLVGLERLVSLRLDNNTITKIENIAHLVNLQWLDLSFNNIKKIEGLETLSKLTDLSLYNNAISEISGLEACVDLQCLSLGNNEIKSTEQIMYLRRFRKLHLVNLDGNPVCDDADYRTVCLAYLKHLKYMDYQLIDPSEVQRAKEMCQDDLMELVEKEAIEAIAKERDESREATMAELRAANIEAVESLFDSMFKDPEDTVKLSLLPGLQDLTDECHEKYKTAAEAFKTLGLEKNAEMEKEQAAVNRGLLMVTTDADKAGVALVTKFAKLMKKVFRELHARGEVEMKDLEGLKRANTGLQEQLMELEMQCIEKAEELIDLFETNLGELRNGMLDIHQTFFRAIEEYESDHYDSTLALVEDLQKKVADEVITDISEELSSLLSDKDTLMTALGVGHDAHVTCLLECEEAMRNKELARFTQTIASMKENETKRSRERVSEIRAVIERNSKMIQDEFAEDYDEDDA